MQRKRVSFHTLGCKLNRSETDTLRQGFLAQGYHVVPFTAPADICLINTCSVTDQADMKCRQTIRRAARISPDAIIVVVGCFAQVQMEQIQSIPEADIILGAGEKFQVFQYLQRWEQTHQRIVKQSDHCEQFALEDSCGYATERTRPLLKIQDGCTYNCSFCIIPTTRGGTRSRPFPSIVQRLQRLSAEGFQEVVLTAVNLAQYHDTAIGDLTSLLQALETLDNPLRYRLGSLEADYLDSRFYGYYRMTRKLCRHMHIPLQSGSTRILRLMHRKYTADQYYNNVMQLLECAPETAIGADVIVGFPGETEEDFAATCTLIESIPFAYLHIFPFSARQDTAAASLGHEVQPAIKKERAKILRSMAYQKKNEYYRSFVGSVQDVLFEGNEGDTVFSGITGNYLRVRTAGQSLANTQRAVLITALDDRGLIGELLDTARCRAAV